MTAKNSSGDFFTSIWDFFASVQLAIFTLCTISFVSIFGTIIPQKEASDIYIQKFGPNVARFFDLFHLSDIFGSLWFKALLALLSANLIICSIDRFSGVWKQVTADNTTASRKRLTAIKRNASWIAHMPRETVKEQLSGFLAQKGWKTVARETQDGIVISSQRGAWTRLGVFVVHGSILVILIGAILGAVFGFKGYVSIADGQATNQIRSNETGAFMNLGFTVRCDGFNIEYYSNGMPKEYRSDLTILENGKKTAYKAVKVNSPLTYKGITFYQSSYQAYNDFLISITDKETGKKKIFLAPFQKQLEWKEENLHFGVINEETAGEKINRIKIWFTDKNGSPSVLWTDTGKQLAMDQGGKHYLLSARQLYSTGLQVAKDPGVWWVYIGCGLILFGLFITFFTSHRKIWLLLSEKDKMTSIYMAGSANKNKIGFDKTFFDLADKLKNLKP